MAGQALVAAVRTVDPRFMVHSLHGYFLRPGNPTMPIVYLVDRIRDGRSFVTRRVSAVQDGQAIFTMSASFQVEDEGIEHQDEMPVVPPPDTLPFASDSDDPEIAWLAQEWSDWDIRMVGHGEVDRRRGAAAQQQAWFRSRKTLPDDPVFHVCALAYMSDMTLIGSAMTPAPPVSRSTVPHSITRCGSCDRSGPTSGCCTTRRHRPPVSVGRSRRAGSSTGRATWSLPSCRKG